ncbi:MAG: GGDEF domain-containing protein [Acidobacteria bacterium]|nr:GGDEF domain-containing protein [Acidobacteriota bacterium]
MESKIGLVIQFTGIFLITALSLFLRRSLKTTASTLWLVAWSSLSVALFSLSLAFIFPSKLLFSVYFFFEYVFGLMLILGCRSLTGEYEFERRSLLLLIPFAMLAMVLSVGIIDFNYVFNIHAFVLGVFFACAYFVLRTSLIRTFGWRVMSVALALLAIDFFHYAAVFSLLMMYPGILPEENYLAFEPIIDLVLEILLGFGMVIVLLEQVLKEIKTVNVQLEEAHEKLKQTAHIDPLTTAFNRHAFYGFLETRNADRVSGCVGFFDIDDLKPINDQLGHTIGDTVIRNVVRVLRDIIRAEDLIYRWGGDEFFVVMLGITESDALSRISRIDRMLTDITLDGVDRPLTVRISYGFKAFVDMSELESAVKAADEEMYRRKMERKTRRGAHISAPVFISNENILVSCDR